MPMTSPRMFSSGPPLLPGLMAASVWMKRWNCFADIGAIHGADDSGGDRFLEPERRADGHRPVAHLHALGIGDGDGLQGMVRVDFQDGDVGFAVEADQLGAIFGIVAVELHLDVVDGIAFLGRDHVLVGDDVAVLIDDEPGAGLLALGIVLGCSRPGAWLPKKRRNRSAGGIFAVLLLIVALVAAGERGRGGWFALSACNRR